MRGPHLPAIRAGPLVAAQGYTYTSIRAIPECAVPNGRLELRRTYHGKLLARKGKSLGWSGPSQGAIPNGLTRQDLL